MSTLSRRSPSVFLMGLVLSLSSHPGCAVDAEAAQAVAKQSNCFRCHGIDKDKDGPSWRKLSAKFKTDAKAVDKLERQITGSVKVKFPDGHEEDHPTLKSNDKAEIRNLIDWILSL